VVPSDVPTVWVENCADAGNSNVAVEMYWQFEATNDARPKAVVDLLEDLMAEPLFDVLRTKQQLGYVASCGLKYTNGVLGFSIWLLSSKVGPAEICRRVEAFLVEFRKQLADMPLEDIEKHVSALAAHKLEPDRTLHSVQEGVWSELQERKDVFDRYLREAVALSSVGRDDVLNIMDDFILRGAPTRRLLVIASIGGKANANKASEVQAIQGDYPGIRVVSSQGEFLASTSLHENMV